VDDRGVEVLGATGSCFVEAGRGRLEHRDRRADRLGQLSDESEVLLE
jgi:hypothetical protein